MNSTNPVELLPNCDLRETKFTKLMTVLKINHILQTSGNEKRSELYSAEDIKLFIRGDGNYDIFTVVGLNFNTIEYSKLTKLANLYETQEVFVNKLSYNESYDTYRLCSKYTAEIIIKNVSLYNLVRL
jgi:hypothetical protein